MYLVDTELREIKGCGGTVSTKKWCK